MSERLDLLLAGMDQPQADHPNSLAEGLPVGATGWAAYRRARHAPGRMADKPLNPHQFGCS
eukprot:1160691-Pelagomonas_calceolata.AAC.1